MDLLKRCPYCGERVVWHRVYRTRAGVRAFCGRTAQDAPPFAHVDELDDEAVDVWWRLHRIQTGEQGSLF